MPRGRKVSPEETLSRHATTVGESAARIIGNRLRGKNAVDVQPAQPVQPESPGEAAGSATHTRVPPPTTLPALQSSSSDTMLPSGYSGYNNSPARQAVAALKADATERWQRVHDSLPLRGTASLPAIHTGPRSDGTAPTSTQAHHLSEWVLPALKHAPVEEMADDTDSDDGSHEDVDAYVTVVGTLNTITESGGEWDDAPPSGGASREESAEDVECDSPDPFVGFSVPAVSGWDGTSYDANGRLVEGDHGEAPNAPIIDMLLTYPTDDSDVAKKRGAKKKKKGLLGRSLHAIGKAAAKVISLIRLVFDYVRTL